MPRRALVVVATFLLAFLLYVDRVCISTAKGPIAAALNALAILCWLGAGPGRRIQPLPS